MTTPEEKVLSETLESCWCHCAFWKVVWKFLREGIQICQITTTVAVYIDSKIKLFYQVDICFPMFVQATLSIILSMSFTC